MYMCFGSRKHVVHKPDCPSIKHVANARRIQLPNIQAAKAAGCCLCGHCLSVAHFYRKEKKAIEAFCAENQLQCTLRDQQIDISSRCDEWRLLLDEYTGGLALFHKNKKAPRKGRSGITMTGYHRQKLSLQSITESLRYISSHDKYREKQEKKGIDKNTAQHQDPGTLIPPNKHNRKNMIAGKRAQKKREKLREQDLWEEIWA